MDEAAKDTNPEESSSAASSKPNKRRRLAHRRQYARSRRAISSYLRSQFVRYEDRDPLGDSWTRTRTLEADQLFADWVQFESNKQAHEIPAWRSDLLQPDSKPKPISQHQHQHQQPTSEWLAIRSSQVDPDGYLTYYISSSLDSCTMDAASSAPSTGHLESPPSQNRTRVRSHEQIYREVDPSSRPESPYFMADLTGHKAKQTQPESFVTSSMSDVSDDLQASISSQLSPPPSPLSLALFAGRSLVLHPIKKTNH